MLKVTIEYGEMDDIMWYHLNEEIIGHGYVDPDDETKFRIYACDELWIINTDGTIENIVSSPYMETTKKYYAFDVFKDDIGDNDFLRPIIEIIEKTAKILAIDLKGAE